MITNEETPPPAAPGRKKQQRSTIRLKTNPGVLVADRFISFILYLLFYFYFYFMGFHFLCFGCIH
jgi:hypothetical protein